MQSVKLPFELCDKLDKLSRDFLWGSSTVKRKMHLVKWDVVCLLRKKGGLGVKNMRLMNQALLAKASWRLAQDDKGLWARMMRGKYCKTGLFVGAAGSDCSATWRGISFGAQLLSKGMQ